jgi:hypothetical protein
MIVGSVSLFTVFATGEETETGTGVMTEPFKKVTKIGFYQSISGWKVISIISKSNKARLVM